MKFVKKKNIRRNAKIRIKSCSVEVYWVNTALQFICFVSRPIEVYITLYTPTEQDLTLKNVDDFGFTSKVHKIYSYIHFYNL